MTNPPSPNSPQRKPRIVCRWCGANPAEDSKIALTRVNEKGVPGIWECTPYCIPDRRNLEHWTTKLAREAGDD